MQQVVKKYNNQTVVKGLDLVIPDGSFTVLVGPSGCGKSTTLRMIAGLEEITAGDLLIDGQRVNDLAPGKRDVAMVFQNYALYPTMNVFDNIAFGLLNRGFSKKDCKRMVEEIAEIVGLSSYLQRKPAELSGGQRQRVALARAMVKKPRVFLMDEPLSNLDAKLRNQMRVELTSLHKQLGTTFIYVTHDQVEAMTMGDQIVVMNEGEIMQKASPFELYQQPANLFVAQFIGSPAMNILPTDKESIGFRPEKAMLTAGSARTIQPAAGFVDHGRIVAREILGSDVLYYVSGRAGKIIARKAADELLAEGTEVTVSVAAEHLYRFDQETGRALSVAAIKQESLPSGGLG